MSRSASSVGRCGVAALRVAMCVALSFALGACRGEPRPRRRPAYGGSNVPRGRRARSDSAPRRATSGCSRRCATCSSAPTRRTSGRARAPPTSLASGWPALPADADPVERWQALIDVAHQELRLGQRGGVHREVRGGLRAAASARREESPDDDRARSVFRLAVAWLRHGETLNCAHRHNAESCILPIRGGGIHTEPKGSREAIRYFVEVLESTPRDSLVNAKALWLLNIAYMTIGDYPDGVPEPYRIPDEVFASERRFPRFENVAGEAGLGQWSLFGGVVTDDFDGDGWLDAIRHHLRRATNRPATSTTTATARSPSGPRKRGSRDSSAVSTWCRPTTTTTAISTSSSCAEPGCRRAAGSPARCCATRAAVDSSTSPSPPAWRS